MPAIRSRAVHLAIAVVCACLLASGCSGRTATSTASTASTSTLAPTTTKAAGAVSGPMTGEELVWLEAIGRLHKKIDKVLVESPSEMTKATLTSLANQLRGCSRELARLAAPSARLEPVYKLVKSGCAQYDKAAACFATAARIGAPIAGTAEERTFNQSIDCGFAAPGQGSRLLAEAEAKGFDIKDRAG